MNAVNISDERVCCISIVHGDCIFSIPAPVINDTQVRAGLCPRIPRERGDYGRAIGLSAAFALFKLRFHSMNRLLQWSFGNCLIPFWKWASAMAWCGIPVPSHYLEVCSKYTLSQLLNASDQLLDEITSAAARVAQVFWSWWESGGWCVQILLRSISDGWPDLFYITVTYDSWA